MVANVVGECPGSSPSGCVRGRAAAPQHIGAEVLQSLPCREGLAGAAGPSMAMAHPRMQQMQEEEVREAAARAAKRDAGWKYLSKAALEENDPSIASGLDPEKARVWRRSFTAALQRVGQQLKMWVPGRAGLVRGCLRVHAA